MSNSSLVPPEAPSANGSSYVLPQLPDPNAGSLEVDSILELDIFTGLLLLACFLIGGLGNTAAFVHFFR